MKKNWTNLVKILSVFVLSLSMISCGDNKTAITSEDFAINSSEIESTNGNYNITLDFYEKAPGVDYIIYENDKEIKSGRKDEKGKNSTDIVFTDKEAGEYLYTVKVEDDNSGIISKEVKVIVKNNKKTEIVPNEDDNNESDDKNNDNVVAWDKGAIEYKVDDEVRYEGKTYECLQSHTSQADWTPVDATSLWKLED